MAAVVSSRASTLLILHVLLGVYALSDVASKMASGTDFFSLPFLLWYGVLLACLGIYALGWQQVIKRMPLSSAYANRAITIVWGIFWGFVLFGEAITPGKIIGAAIIACGIVLFARADHADAQAADDAGGEGGEGA